MQLFKVNKMDQFKSLKPEFLINLIHTTYLTCFLFY